MQSRRRSRLPVRATSQPRRPDGPVTAPGRPPAERTHAVTTPQPAHTQRGSATRTFAPPARPPPAPATPTPASTAVAPRPGRGHAADRSPRPGWSIRSDQHRLRRPRRTGGSSTDASPSPCTPVITASSRAPPQQAHQHRLPQRAAAQPAHVEGVLAHPQHTVPQMQHARIATEHQVAVRQPATTAPRATHDATTTPTTPTLTTTTDPDPVRRVGAGLRDALGDPHADTRLVRQADRRGDHHQPREAQRAVPQP